MKKGHIVEESLWEHVNRLFPYDHGPNCIQDYFQINDNEKGMFIKRIKGMLHNLPNYVSELKSLKAKDICVYWFADDNQYTVDFMYHIHTPKGKVLISLYVDISIDTVILNISEISQPSIKFKWDEAKYSFNFDSVDNWQSQLLLQ